MRALDISVRALAYISVRSRTYVDASHGPLAHRADQRAELPSRIERRA